MGRAMKAEVTRYGLRGDLREGLGWRPFLREQEKKGRGANWGGWWEGCVGGLGGACAIGWGVCAMGGGGSGVHTVAVEKGSTVGGMG